jgi:hypothetical protein
VLCDHAVRDGRTWPSIPTIVRESGIGDERAVRHALRMLEAQRVIHGLTKKAGGVGRSTVYRLLFASLPERGDPLVLLDAEPTGDPRGLDEVETRGQGTRVPNPWAGHTRTRGQGTPEPVGRAHAEASEARRSTTTTTGAGGSANGLDPVEGGGGGDASKVEAVAALAAQLQLDAATGVVRYPSRWKAKATTTLTPAAVQLVTAWPDLDVETLARHVADETQPRSPRRDCPKCGSCPANATQCPYALDENGCALGLPSP